MHNQNLLQILIIEIQNVHLIHKVRNKLKNKELMHNHQLVNRVWQKIKVNSKMKTLIILIYKIFKL